MELRFIKDRQRAGIETAKAQSIYKGRAKNVDDAEIRRRIKAGATKAEVARSMVVRKMAMLGRAVPSEAGSGRATAGF